jgi:hypothetical protein
VRSLSFGLLFKGQSLALSCSKLTNFLAIGRLFQPFARLKIRKAYVARIF